MPQVAVNISTSRCQDRWRRRVPRRCCRRPLENRRRPSSFSRDPFTEASIGVSGATEFSDHRFARYANAVELIKRSTAA